MQKPIKRGNTWRIEVKYKNQRYVSTFPTERECEVWANQKLIELRLLNGEEFTSNITYITLFDLYILKVGKQMRGYSFIKQQRKAFIKYWRTLAHTPIKDIQGKDIALWRNQRLEKVTTGTVQRQMCLYSSVFNFACHELFILEENPFTGITKPKKPKPRHQRINQEQIDKILTGLDYTELKTPTEPRHYVAWSFLFALETALRKGEILQLTSEHLHDDYLHLPITKNGTSRDVPLTIQAKQLLSILPKSNSPTSYIIPHTSNSFRLIWQRNLHRVGLNGIIKFHDTRHESITRFVHQYKLPVEILAKITGHKDIKTLINTYYNPTGKELAKILNQEHQQLQYHLMQE